MRQGRVEIAEAQVGKMLFDSFEPGGNPKRLAGRLVVDAGEVPIGVHIEVPKLDEIRPAFGYQVDQGGSFRWVIGEAGQDEVVQRDEFSRSFHDVNRFLDIDERKSLGAIVAGVLGKTGAVHADPN